MFTRPRAASQPHRTDSWRRLLSLAAFALLPSVVLAVGSAGDSACRPLPGSEQRLCVSTIPGQTSRWSLVPGGEVDVPMSGSRLYDFSISANGRWVALISADEGHPVFDLVAIDTLASNGHGRNQITIDPYPGSLWIGDWDGDQLALGSSVPLDNQPPSLPDNDALEYHYRLNATEAALHDRTVSIVAPEPITFAARYDAEQRQWHCDCTLAEGDRKKATDNLSWLHLALPTGRTLVLEVAVSHALAGKQGADACVRALLDAIRLPTGAPVNIHTRTETLPENTGVQIEMKVVDRSLPE